MERGTRIHKLAEDYVSGVISELPNELSVLSSRFEQLRALGNAKCELEWAFTSSWSPTDWFAKDTWLRVKADVLFEQDDQLYIVDHKTGKRYDDHRKQLSLYALASFTMLPSIGEISAEA